MKYIVLLLVLFLNNSVYANTNKIFNSYKELNTCIGKFENFKQYKTNLEKCLQSKEVEITIDYN